MRALVAGLVLAVVAVGCGSNPPADDSLPVSTLSTTTTTTRPESTTKPSTAATTATTTPSRSGGDPLVWKPCGTNLECGELEVPLDHDQPDGQQLVMALIRVPASGTAEGSIFVNPGGPGASGVDFVRSGFRFDAETMSRYDLIGFDPRGIGLSSPLSCSIDRSRGPLPDLSPDDESEEVLLQDWSEAESKACTDTTTRLANQSTMAVARDLDLARQAVGEERLNLYGLSYGTYIGLVYSALYPDRVGRIVLDGVVDPENGLSGLLEAQAVGFGRSFQSLVDDCLNRPTSLAYQCPSDPIDVVYDRVMARLEEAPVGQVGPTELTFATLISLYDESFHAVYVPALTAADEGNYASIEALSDSLAAVVSTGSYLGTLCMDYPEPSDPEGWDELAARLQSADRRFGAVLANEIRACATWPARPDPSTATPIDVTGTEATIVVVGATGDPATPLTNAESVASQVRDGRLVIVDAQQHTSYSPSGCLADIVAAFFVENEAPADQSRC